MATRGCPVATDRELEQELAEIAQTVERLRVHYQQYFMGFEKVPPTVIRDQLERRIRYSELHHVRRAALRFRWDSLLQKYRIYTVLWDRLLRDIEEGRLSRDAFKRMEPERVAPRLDTVPEGPGASARPEESPAPVQPDDPVLALFRQYMSARESVGLPTNGITEAAFRAGLEKQAGRLGVQVSNFSVAVRDGKVILVARATGPAATSSQDNS